MKRSMQLMILLVLASGCAGKHWTKEGATEADFSRDSYACVRESTSREASFKFGYGGGYSDELTVAKEPYRACMRAHGYQFVEGGQWVGPRD